MDQFKYIYPPNARYQEQLDIMLRQERSNKDPLDLNYIEQPVLFTTKYWYVTRNRYPYDGAEMHFLIIALEGVYHLEDLTDEMRQDFFEVWLKLVNDYDACGGGLCWRFGSPACSGASLTRVHAHLIMPQADKKVKVSIGGKRKLDSKLSID